MAGDVVTAGDAVTGVTQLAAGQREDSDQSQPPAGNGVTPDLAVPATQPPGAHSVEDQGSGAQRSGAQPSAGEAVGARESGRRSGSGRRTGTSRTGGAARGKRSAGGKPGADSPAAPDKPGASDQPAAADQPAAWDRPAAPDKPAASDKPAGPDKPAASGKAEASDKPAAPDKSSGGSDKAAAPDKSSGGSDKAAAPDKSGGSDKPGGSDQANAPDKPGGSDQPGARPAASDQPASDQPASGKPASERPASDKAVSDKAARNQAATAGAAEPAAPSDNEAAAVSPDAVPAAPAPGSSGSSGRRYSGRASRKDTLTRAGVAARAAAADGASGTAAVRRRLARLGTARSSGMNPVLEPLIKTVRLTHPKADIRPLERAYETAARLHKGQDRKSGDPYITHPLAVATILAELGMNTETLAAALLHDTIEDTDYTLGQLRTDFGADIAALVDGVTKLDKVKYGDAAQAETVRKMVVAMSRDIRVLVIKLADRLHNMRTLRYLPRPKQEQKSREVLEIFAPLAHRLGMNTVKWELEDLAFATLYPKRYDEIARLVSERSPRREMFLQEVSEDVNTDLREAKIKAMVTGRPKHYYSVYQKMIARNVGFDDIYDLVGIRVLVDSLRDCYAALGIIHARWNPVPGRFKDYIAMPKFNMYQSLHTTVIGPEGKPVELQIRTWGMHRRAEYGVAAHWKYKEEMTSAAGTGSSDMAWLRQLVDWQRETTDPAEFLDSLRFDLGAAEVYVFTPRGEVIALPQGATPVDFAYAIHTEVGHRTIGARVNGRLVPLESALDNGDTVEIFTSKATDAGPSRDWLGFVKSARARNKIRHWFSKERREAAAETGKAAIARAMRKQGLPLQRLATADALNLIAQDLHYNDLSALYAAVGESHVSAQSVVGKLIKSAGGIAGAQEDLAETTLPARTPRPLPAGDSGVVVEDAADVWARLSKCCTPVPGDEITGFVTRGNGVSVHRADCVNLQHLLQSQAERQVSVRWSPREGSQFLVGIQVEALDRTGLLSDVTRTLSDQHVNILSATVTTTRDRVAFSKFTFEMGDPKHLGHVLRAVRSIDGVYDVYRLTS